MATTPQDDELNPNTVRPDDAPGTGAAHEPTPEEIKAGAAKLTALLHHLGYEETKSKTDAPRPDREPREDVKRNRAEIRKVMLRYIKNEHRAATVQEICEETGLSEKTVKAHRKHIKLGDGKTNMYQHLTHDVMLAIFKKSIGYTYESEKLLTVSSGAGLGSSVERHDITLFVQPDMGAAKLWLQMVEGLSEKQETKHSGSIATGAAAFTFNYVVPTEPGTDGK